MTSTSATVAVELEEAKGVMHGIKFFRNKLARLEAELEAAKSDLRLGHHEFRHRKVLAKENIARITDEIIRSKNTRDCVDEKARVVVKSLRLSCQAALRNATTAEIPALVDLISAVLELSVRRMSTRTSSRKQPWCCGATTTCSAPSATRSLPPRVRLPSLPPPLPPRVTRSHSWKMESWTRTPNDRTRLCRASLFVVTPLGSYRN